MINYRVDYENIQNAREYNDKVNFIRRLPDIRAEIELKEKVIGNFLKVIDNLTYRSSQELMRITKEYKPSLKALDKLAALLDSHDDLIIYEKLDKSFSVINK